MCIQQANSTVTTQKRGLHGYGCGGWCKKLRASDRTNERMRWCISASTFLTKHSDAHTYTPEVLMLICVCTCINVCMRVNVVIEWAHHVKAIEYLWNLQYKYAWCICINVCMHVYSINVHTWMRFESERAKHHWIVRKKEQKKNRTSLVAEQQKGRWRRRESRWYVECKAHRKQGKRAFH